jgi:outer membrane protein
MSVKQQRKEKAFQTKAQKLQEDYMKFQQSVGQGLLSENQSIAQQKELMIRKEELDRMEVDQQKFVQEMRSKNDEIWKTVVEHIKEYNKVTGYDYILSYDETPMGVILANDSLDITNDILNGLNAKYKAGK